MKATAPASISSLVITLTSDPEAEPQALAALSGIEGLDFGEYHRPWLAAVLESPFPADVCRFIREIPGVVLVEVTFVEVPDDETPVLANP